MVIKVASNNKYKLVLEKGESERKHEAGYHNEFLKITAEDRADLQGTEFYIIDKERVNSVRDAVEIYSEVIIPNNQNLIGHILGIPMSY